MSGNKKSLFLEEKVSAKKESSSLAGWPLVSYTSVAKRSSERHLLLVPHWSYGSDGAGDEEPQELEEYVPPVSRLFSFFRELLSLKKKTDLES